MPAPILILAITGFLAVAAITVLAVLITGIRRGDRSHLANSPGSHSDAFARRILVGVRFPADDEEGDEQ
jgi:hypothetical protein